jgi:Glycosyl transferase family 2
VEHFYLTDDGSTDNAHEILSPYIAAGQVTMYDAISKWKPFRQTGMYKGMFLDLLFKNESQWVAVIDLDEYLYAPDTRSIPSVLKQHEDLAVVGTYSFSESNENIISSGVDSSYFPGVNWLIFGSSGYELQPKSLIQSFVYRAEENPNKYIKLIEQYKILKW